MNYKLGIIGIACAGCFSLSSCFFPASGPDDDESDQENGDFLGGLLAPDISDDSIDDVQSRDDRWISDCDIQNNETEVDPFNWTAFLAHSEVKQPS